MTSQHEALQPAEQDPYAEQREVLETTGLPALLETRRKTITSLYKTLAANPAAQPIPWIKSKRMSEWQSSEPMVQASLGDVALTGSTMNIGTYGMRPVQQITIARAESDVEPRVFNTDTSFDPFRGDDYPSVRGLQQVVEDIITLQTLCDQLQPVTE